MPQERPELGCLGKRVTSSTDHKDCNTANESQMIFSGPTLPNAAENEVYFAINRYLLTSVSGLVVKFVVAIDEPGVRFPPDARNFDFLFFSLLQSSQLRQRIHPACTNMKHIIFRTSTTL